MVEVMPHYGQWLLQPDVLVKPLDRVRQGDLYIPVAGRLYSSDYQPKILNHIWHVMQVMNHVYK